MADQYSTPRCVVYGLYDPRDGELRYIGKTVDSVARRLRGHINGASVKPTYSARWIQSLLSQSLKPVAIVLEQILFPDMLGEIEQRWIRWARANSTHITNLTDGGEGLPGLRHSPATIDKMRLSALARSPERDAKVGAALRGYKHSAEARRHMSEAHLGHVLTPEHRQKLSLAQLGRPKTQAHRDHISMGKTGRPVSAATRANMCAAQRREFELNPRKRAGKTGRWVS